MNCVARAYPNTFAARLKSRAFPASGAIHVLGTRRDESRREPGIRLRLRARLRARARVVGRVVPQTALIISTYLPRALHPPSLKLRRTGTSYVKTTEGTPSLKQHWTGASYAIADYGANPAGGCRKTFFDETMGCNRAAIVVSTDFIMMPPVRHPQGGRGCTRVS